MESSVGPTPGRRNLVPGSDPRTGSRWDYLGQRPSGPVSFPGLLGSPGLRNTTTSSFVPTVVFGTGDHRKINSRTHCRVRDVLRESGRGDVRVGGGACSGSGGSSSITSIEMTNSGLIYDCRCFDGETISERCLILSTTTIWVKCLLF